MVKEFQVFSCPLKTSNSHFWCKKLRYKSRAQLAITRAGDNVVTCANRQVIFLPILKLWSSYGVELMTHITKFCHLKFLMATNICKILMRWLSPFLKFWTLFIYCWSWKTVVCISVRHIAKYITIVLIKKLNFMTLLYSMASIFLELK